jgi:hypothetical protein
VNRLKTGAFPAFSVKKIGLSHVRLSIHNIGQGRKLLKPHQIGTKNYFRIDFMELVHRAARNTAAYSCRNVFNRTTDKPSCAERDGKARGDMGFKRFINTAASFILLFSILFTTACSDGVSITPVPGRQAHTVPVDPVFKEFYQTLGGQQVLGPAISALEIRENLQCQFAERALMCFNPAVTDANRFSLYPLGRELGIQEESQLTGVAAITSARVVDGYVIYEKFIPLYDQLYGARYVGRPLTDLQINHDLQRAEQFFENVGFYQSLTDPNGPVYLTPYGAYLCGGSCSYRLSEYWSIVKSNIAEQPFAASIARLGGPAVFGSLLLKPQLAADGYLEQAYANTIFFAPPEDPSQVRLRPLPLLLDYDVHPLVEKKSHEQLVFYEIENGLGHNVPRPFDLFVAMHGGRDLAGKPISEVVLLPGKNLYQQCFENYCLLYDPAASDVMKVRMAPLGKDYLKRFPAPEDAQIRNIFSPEKITLVVAADKPNISDNQEQIIRMLVFQSDTKQAMQRVEANLILGFQDRPSIRYTFPPTDGNGVSAVVIPPQAELVNGSRLSYQVCLNLPSEQPICAIDSYLIWNIP